MIKLINPSSVTCRVSIVRLFYMDHELIREILSYLNFKEFIIYSFMICKTIKENYKKLIYEELIEYLLNFWNINNCDMIYNSIHNIISVTNESNINTKISFLKSMLFKSSPIIESYRNNNPENIQIYEILHKKSSHRSTIASIIVHYDSKYSPSPSRLPSTSSSTSPDTKRIIHTSPWISKNKIVQYTGVIGVGNRSIVLQSPFPVQTDLIQAITEELHQLYLTSLAFTSNITSTIHSNSIDVIGTAGNVLNTISILPYALSRLPTIFTYLSTMGANNSSSTSPSSDVSLQSIQKAMKLLRRLYHILKTTATATATNHNNRGVSGAGGGSTSGYYDRKDYPVFSTPFVCKNSRITRHRHRHTHDTHTNKHTASDDSLPMKLSADGRYITSCNLRSVAYYEITVKPNHNSANTNTNMSNTNNTNTNMSNNNNSAVSSLSTSLLSLLHPSYTNNTTSLSSLYTPAPSPVPRYSATYPPLTTSSSSSSSQNHSSRSLQSLTQFFTSNTTTNTATQQQQSSSWNNTNNNNTIECCVAIGLATDQFDNNTRFPGWDFESYGYHGDDGGYSCMCGCMFLYLRLYLYVILLQLY